MKKFAFVSVVVTYLTLLAQAQTLKVVNAASFSETAGLAPGALVTIFGQNLANTTASASDPANLPRTLGGVTLTVAGVACPLLYVSPTQVNAVTDPSVPLGMADLKLTTSTGSVTTKVNIEAAAPGLFSMSGSGSHDGAILNAITFQPGSFSTTTGGAPTFLALFATGLDPKSTPTVKIGGVVVPVQFFGNAPLFVGLQQINVQLVDSLAGSGRVEVTVESNEKKSNVVEAVILPRQGEGEFPSDKENERRSREVAAIATVPNSSLALVADENDDVIRVIDVQQKKVVSTIVLTEDSEPVAVAVDAAGKQGVVAERERNRAAILDLGTSMVKSEVSVERGPVAVAIANSTALVVNQDSDSVSIFDLGSTTAPISVKVGRAPRSIAVDAAAGRAYVVNQGDGTISVLDIAGKKVLSKLDLGPNARPAAIQVIPSLSLGVVTEPSAGPQGKVTVFNLTTGAVLASIDVNPDRSGGSSDIAVMGNTVFFANQAGGSVTAAALEVSGANVKITPTTIKTGLGVRALAIDAKDNALLATNEGSGTIAVIDLSSKTVTARIDAVRSEHADEKDEDDDHDDRQRGANLPVITSLTPAAGKAGQTVNLTITGTHLAGATGVLFFDPAGLPGKGKDNEHDKDGHGDHGDAAKPDSGFTVSKIQVNAAGTQLTADVLIAAGHAAGARLVRVVTPNGESPLVPTPATTFTVTQ